MSVSLTHSTPSLAGARTSASSAASSWLAKLLLALASWPEVLAEAREEERKAHERFPFVEW